MVKDSGTLKGPVHEIFLQPLILSSSGGRAEWIRAMGGEARTGGSGERALRKSHTAGTVFLGQSIPLHAASAWRKGVITPPTEMPFTPPCGVYALLRSKGTSSFSN